MARVPIEIKTVAAVIIRKVVKNGNSRSLNIPSVFMNRHKIRDDDDLVVYDCGDALLVCTAPVSRKAFVKSQLGIYGKRVAKSKDAV